MSDLALIKQHAAAVLPRRMARDLAAQIDQIIYLDALAEAASNDQALILRSFSVTLSDALDEIDRRLISQNRLTPTQQQELDAQVDLVLANNRQLLDEAHDYALQLIREAGSRPRAPQRSGWEALVVEITGEDTWSELKRSFVKVWGS